MNNSKKSKQLKSSRMTSAQGIFAHNRFIIRFSFLDLELARLAELLNIIKNSGYQNFQNTSIVGIDKWYKKGIKFVSSYKMPDSNYNWMPHFHTSITVGQMRFTVAVHFTSLMNSSISSLLNILKLSAGVMVASSTLVELSFSSITCLRIVRACTHASFNVIDL